MSARNPRTYEPGARIEWTQYHADGTRTERAGTVWERAPEVDGAKIVCWVVPDTRLPTDSHSAVAVGKATRDHHFRDLRTPRVALKRELFSVDECVQWGHPLERLMSHAEQLARIARADNEVGQHSATK